MIIKFTIELDLDQINKHEGAPAKAFTTCAEPVPVPVTPKPAPSKKLNPVTKTATTAGMIGYLQNSLC